MIPLHLIPETDPKAHPHAMVRFHHARFTLLTSRLIRIEYDPDAQFKDRASQAFWFRNQPVPAFSVKKSKNNIHIETDHLLLLYQYTEKGFTPETLSVTLKENGQTWHYGDVDPENLKGTCRTLDLANGPVALEDGPLSRSGWAMIDDSTSPLLDERGWIRARPHPHVAKDLYFFGYGRDYQSCLNDFFFHRWPHSADPALGTGKLVEPLLAVSSEGTAGLDDPVPKS